MMAMELNDILFLVKSLKNPSDHFNIYHYISMSTTTSRSSSHLKIKHGHSYSAKYLLIFHTHPLSQELTP